MYELRAPSDLSNAELHELMQVLTTLSDGDSIEVVTGHMIERRNGEVFLNDTGPLSINSAFLTIIGEDYRIGNDSQERLLAVDGSLKAEKTLVSISRAMNKKSGNSTEHGAIVQYRRMTNGTLLERGCMINGTWSHDGWDAVA